MSDVESQLILAALVVVASAAISWLRSSHLLKVRLPPGPPLVGWLSGHTSILPFTKPWEVYTQWADTYGPVMHLRAYNHRIIVLSSMEDCIELFEKRSSLYSDRPTYAMVDLMAWDFSTVAIPYGPHWRTHRRLFQQMFRKVSSLVYRPEQTRKINDMLYGLLTSPKDFREHIHTLSGAIVMSSTYGYDIQPKNDHFIELAEESVARIAEAVLPGARLVNYLPILRYIPKWFPGAEFHRFAAKGKQVTTAMIEKPFQWTQQQIQKGANPDCMVAAKLPSYRTQEDIIALKNVAATIYVAGADTTTAVLHTFIYVMAAVSPDAQKKAQQEIDRVVGRDRLPTYDDWEFLPYTEAIMRETFRWRPIVPLGAPHRVTSDDIYKGYLIPKGSLIIGNAWALSRDASVYEDPNTFSPDRFFNKDGTLNDDDSDYTFGFGRRKCPGQHMARATVVWLSMATILWAFNIGKDKDASGKEIPIDDEYSTGMVSHKEPYVCAITPRSSEVGQIVMEAALLTKERLPYKEF